MSRTRRFTLHWTDEAIATGQTLDATQREAAERQAEALRQNPYAWMSNLTFWRVSPKGHKLWHIPGATVQLIFYVEKGEVWIDQITTYDIPPLEERD